MKIGIAVITRNRPEVLLDTVRAIINTTDFAKYAPELIIGIDRDPVTEKVCDKHGLNYVATAVPGIASNRNVSVHALDHCDIIVLFEDDFRPVKNGWLERIVQVLAPGDVPYLLNLWDPVHGPLAGSRLTIGGEVELYPYSTTYMLALTKKTLEKVGYWSPEFGDRYGYEEAEWGLRVKKAFGWDPDLWPSLPNTQEFFAQAPEIPSSDNKTQGEREADIAVNHGVWCRLLAEGLTYQPYPY